MQLLWEILSGCNLELVLPLIYHPTSVYSNDKGVIDEAIKLKLFDKEELKLFNIVRMHFKVIFILDLIESNNNKIRECFYEISEQECTRDYKWLRVVLSVKYFKL